MIVLTAKKLKTEKLQSEGVQEIIITDNKQLREYQGREDVVAVCCTRMMAKEVEKINFPNLKLVQLTSAGYENVPYEKFVSKGINVANAGNIYSFTMAETIVFSMLQFAKRLRNNPNNRRFKLVRKYKKIVELKGKSAIILGAGNIGTATAKRLVGFDMHLDAYDPYCVEKAEFCTIYRDRTEMIKNLKEYDYVISTLPASEETKNFVDKELLDSMNLNAVFINVGRKSTIKESDLYKHLKAKKIKGAVLDMFELIPNPITNKFRRLSNVIVMPGVSAISQESTDALAEMMTNNVISVINEKTPVNLIQ